LAFGDRRDGALQRRGWLPVARLVLYGVEFVPGITVSGTITGIVGPYSSAVELARGTLVVRAGASTLRVRIARSVLRGY
jgi:hypothetical protein